MLLDGKKRELIISVWGLWVTLSVVPEVEFEPRAVEILTLCHPLAL